MTSHRKIPCRGKAVLGSNKNPDVFLFPAILPRPDTIVMDRAFSRLDPESYLFPHHCVVCRGGFAEYHLYETDLRRPIGSWKRAWKYACRKSGVAYRWHDLRHTFVSRLAEDPAVARKPFARWLDTSANRCSNDTVTYGSTPKKLPFWVSRMVKSRIRHARPLARGHKIRHNRRRIDWTESKKP